MGKGLPYRRGKPSDRITTRFFFEIFPLVLAVPCVREDGKYHHLLVDITVITNLVCRAFVTGVGVFSPPVKKQGIKRVDARTASLRRYFPQCA
jgi:hypothetical protein